MVHAECRPDLQPRSRAWPSATLVLAASLTACAAGPDFHRPQPDLGGGYLPAARQESITTPSVPPLGAQSLVQARDIERPWWRHLGSPKLDRAIEAALQRSPTIAEARARLQQAQEQRAGQQAATAYPRLAAGAGAAREQLPGKQAATRQGLDLDAKRDATTRMLHAQQEQLHITRDRLSLGQATPADVLTLQTQLGQLRASLSRLEKRLEQNRHLLAVLAGERPDEAPATLFELEDFVLPAALPVIVPSALVRRRPDIRAAEALMHEASAAYGVAVSRLYPQLNLNASLGSQALNSGALFGTGSGVWGLVAQLTQPLFDPSLAAEKRAALAALDAAAAHYRLVVLQALRDVADVLRAIEKDGDAFAALSAADISAQATLEAVRRGRRLGAASQLELLVAVGQAQQVRIDLIDSYAERLASSVALYRSMGGAGASDGS